MKLRNLSAILLAAPFAFAACGSSSGDDDNGNDVGSDADVGDGGDASDGGDTGVDVSPVDEICDDAIDNDGDGDADCDDSDCAEAAECVVEVCDDGLDNDGDSDADCDDADCVDDIACAVELCDDGIDNDGDDLIDCEDDGCDDELLCTPEICDDAEDNDGDELIDCADDECADEIICAAEICDDGEDNDADDLIDCDDDECLGTDICPIEICDDGIDNDADELIDCEDDECLGTDTCPIEICDDGVDNDADDLIDCEDDNCTDEIVCADEICDDLEDNDADDLIDCEDMDCLGDDACLTVEMCDDGADNDGDDLIDCEDVDDCATHPACLCGDGVVDDGEACDDGDLNSDEDADACRTTCELAACGDGVVDAGEECDGTPGCSALCIDEDPTDECGTGNAFTLNDDYRIDDEADLYRFITSVVGVGETVPPALPCLADFEDTGDEFVLVFRPSADGDYYVSTDLDGTNVDTILVVREANCTADVGIACNDDIEFGDTLNSEVTFTATAGTVYYITVDTWLDEVGEVEVEVGSVTVAVDLEACDPPQVVCGGGEVCVNPGRAGICESLTVPTLTTLQVVQYNEGGQDFVAIRALGADDGFDVVGFGGQFDDGVNPFPFQAAFNSVIFAGSDYEANGVYRSGDLLGNGYDSFDASVIDSANQISPELSTTVQLRATVTAGAPCDQFLTVCGAGLACLSEICTADLGAAPELSAATVTFDAPDALIFQANGTDADGDAVGLELTWLDEFGTAVGGITNPIERSFSNNTIGQTTWAGQFSTFSANVSASADLLHAVEMRAVDSAGNYSPQIITQDLPWPERVGDGGACYVDGSVSVCEAGFDCDDVVDGVGTCRPFELQMLQCRASATAEGWRLYTEFESTGATSERDSVAFMWFDLYAGATRLTGLSLSDVDDGNWYQQSNVGLNVTLTTAMVDASVTHIECYVGTYTGFASNRVRANIVPPAADMTACDPALEASICARGLVCVADIPECAISAAPTATLGTVARTDIRTLTFDIDVEDIDGDVVGYYLDYVDASGAPLLIPFSWDQRFDSPDPVYGETSTTVTIDVSTTDAGLDSLWPNVAEVVIGVHDLAGNVVEVRVDPGNLAVGDACVADADSIPCAAPTTCVSDVCTAP